MRQIGIHSGSSNIDHSRRPAGYDLTSVEVALFATGEGEPIIRSAILGSGIRRLTVVTSPEMLRSAICKTEFDMIVLEASEQVEGICDQISDIRQGLLGENPYVVINVASWLSSNDAIRTFINAGTDDITVMPTSVDAVVARLDHIIETRKKFVATLKYLGPDRRAPDRAKTANCARSRYQTACATRPPAICRQGSICRRLGALIASRRNIGCAAQRCNSTRSSPQWRVS